MDNDLSKAHQEKAQSRQLADDMAFVDSIIGEDTTETPEPTGEDSVIAATAKDVGRGVVEMPVQTAGVFSDMINDVSELAYDVGNWANENLADLGQITWGDDGVSWQSGVPDENLLKVPTTPKAVSKTGQVYREMMNFVGLYVGAGKFRGLAEGLKLGAKTNPTVSKAMLQGFVADYVNKPEDNLSKLIQSYPDLENPVTEWLACDEDCSEMDKRLRTAIEGLGIGAATEAGFFGMRKALGALKASRKVKDEIIKEGVVPEQDLAPEVVKELTSLSRKVSVVCVPGNRPNSQLKTKTHGRYYRT